MEILGKEQITNNKLSKERLENLALTNYFLAKIRKKLKVEGEVFSKWFMDGFFNGAFLVGKTIEYHADFYFSENEIDSRDYWTVVKLRNVWFSTTSKAAYQFDYKEEARKITAEFEELLKTKGEAILSQVKRFLLYAGCWEKGENPQRVKGFIDNICAEFPNSNIYLNQQILPYSSNTMHDYDVEIIINKPISKDEFIERLKKYIPNLQEPIFGFGFHERNPAPDTEFWITLYARQF